MGFDQKSDLDHIVSFVNLQHEYFDWYLHVIGYNQLLKAAYVVLT